MAKTHPAKSQAERNKRQAGRCWDGYEPTPGKAPGTKGSCKPKASTSKSAQVKQKRAHGRSASTAHRRKAA